MTGSVAFTIVGEPASKANSREIITVGPKHARRVLVRKSDKALAYEKAALAQIPPIARVRLEGPVEVEIRVFYASERPDLDESVILDVLQDRYAKNPAGERVLVQHGVYRNDRQVRRKIVEHGIDRKNPRAEIVVRPMQAQQSALELEPLPLFAAEEAAPL